MRPPGCAVALTAAAVFAGIAAAREQQDSALILRFTTRLVQVEVVVRDANGRPVTGLRQGDFEVRENGKLQEIRFFTDHAGAVKRTSDLPPGMVSNRLETTGPRHGVTVVLIDSLNTDWQYKAQALVNLRKFLEGAQPDDHIAIYTLGRKLKIFHEFTGDARSLRQKLDRYRNAPVWSEGEAALMNVLMDSEASAFLRWTLKIEDEAKAVARAEATFDALEKVANRLGPRPGWKSMVSISSGVPMQLAAGRPLPSAPGARQPGGVRSFEREFDRAVRAATDSNIAVYPIDPAGLQESRASARDCQSLQTGSMLTQLAASTDGRTYVGKNDILGALQQVTEGAQASGTVAYCSSNTSFDGRYQVRNFLWEKAEPQPWCHQAQAGREVGQDGSDPFDYRADCSLDGKPRFGADASSGAGPARAVSLCPRLSFVCPACGQRASASVTHALRPTTQNRDLS